MTHTEAIRDVVLELDAAGLDVRQRRRVIEHMGHYKTLGEAAFWTLQNDRDNESLHDLPGWPECACAACGCTNPATCTDDGGVEVCGACSDYTLCPREDITLCILEIPESPLQAALSQGAPPVIAQASVTRRAVSQPARDSADHKRIWDNVTRRGR